MAAAPHPLELSSIDDFGRVMAAVCSAMAPDARVRVSPGACQNAEKKRHSPLFVGTLLDTGDVQREPGYIG